MYKKKSGWIPAYTLKIPPCVTVDKYLNMQSISNDSF